MKSNDQEHFRKLESMYLSAPVNKWYKPEIVVEKKKCAIKINVDPKYYHAAHAVHGSVYFKMLDDSSFFAVNSIVKDVFVLTTGFTLHFLRPLTEGEILAEGKVIFASNNMFVTQSELYNDKNKLIAQGNGSFMKSKIPLTDKVGYK